MKKKHPLAKAKLKYARHKAQSKFRDIEFNLTFNEWYDWWLSNGVDKNTQTFNKYANRLCMCRYNDVGPYELGNIYLANHLTNIMDNHATLRKNKKRYLYDGEYVTGQELEVALGTNDPIEKEKYKLINLKRKLDVDKRAEYFALREEWNKLWGSKSKRTAYQIDNLCVWIQKDCKHFDQFKGQDVPHRIRSSNFENYKEIYPIGPSLEDYVKQKTRFVHPYLKKPKIKC